MLLKISEIKENPNNPRTIRDDKFNKLVKSIKEFPEMLNVRSIVIDENNVVLGGNMRLKALKDAGIKEVDVKQVKGWSEEKKKEFVIKDNASFGEWDWDILANEWDDLPLEDWGLDVPSWEKLDYSEKNKEIDIDDLDNKMTIKLDYTENEYWKVKEALSKISQNPEQAVYKLLGLDNE